KTIYENLKSNLVHNKIEMIFSAILLAAVCQGGLAENGGHRRTYSDNFEVFHDPTNGLHTTYDQSHVGPQNDLHTTYDQIHVDPPNDLRTTYDHVHLDPPNDLHATYDQALTQKPCQDNDPSCPLWGSQGECYSNP
ncbi:unnamed protein product, partial [Meganyctiphanes norvegica]